MDIFWGTPTAGVISPLWLTPSAVGQVAALHQSIPGYEPTPLLELPSLASKLGLGRLFVKDESLRFGQNSFKGLGGSCAVFSLAARKLGVSVSGAGRRYWTLEDLLQLQHKSVLKNMVFSAATDGNHGRGVAWASSLLGARSRIFMPAGTVSARQEAVRSLPGAEVEVTNQPYDETVSIASAASKKHGWSFVQDTSLPGPSESVTKLVIQGYTTLAQELLAQLKHAGSQHLTHIFIQCGVGSLAAGVAGYLFSSISGKNPVLSIVEADGSDCVLESMRHADGLPHGRSTSPTIMAGLNCGTPCALAWPFLRDAATAFFSCPDSVSAHGMRLYHKPLGSDPVLVSGESGAVTLGLLDILCTESSYGTVRERLRLDKTATVVLLSTEGATNPESWLNAVENNAYPLVL